MSDDRDIAGKAGDDDATAAEFALGILPEAEHEGVRARLQSEPSLRAELRAWRRRLSGLDSGFAETVPSPAVWARVEQRLFPAAAKASIWDSLGLWRGLTAALAAVAVIAIGVNLLAPRPDPNAFAAQLVAALSAQGSNVQVVALYNAQSGEVRLTTLSGAKVPDKDYELWAIEADQKPKSLGLLRIDARNDVKLPQSVQSRFGPGTTLAISLEPLGGSPSPDGPTGPVVAAGKATPI